MDSGASSGSSSSQICAICLASMKAGEAIFTSECAHSFHFQCIASNVNHGNRTCPTCRTYWQQVPQQAVLHPVNNPYSQQQNSFSRFSPFPATNLPPQNPFSRYSPYPAPNLPLPQRQNPFPAPYLTFPPPQNVFRSSPVNEPAMFNDDEALDIQSLNNNINNNNITSGGSSLRRVLMKTYTEVPAVPRSSIVDDFAVLINLKAPILASGRASVDLVTVLDISGSMMGNKLSLLKRAMGFVIQNLGPGDRLSVVVFSTTAQRLFPLRKMSDTGKQHALQAVNSLVADGGTSIAEGLRTGAKVLNDRQVKNPVASMILLSDGQDNYCGSMNGGAWVTNSGGGQNRSNLRSLFLQGIDAPVHAFGFGTDHDASLLHAISEMTGGTFSFIETESVIQDAFAQCIGGLLSVVVKGLRVMVESVNPSIGIQSLKTGSYASHLTADRKSGRIEVGDLYADEERDFLVSVNVPREMEMTYTLLLKVNCYYTDPMTNETVNLASENVTIERPESVGIENVVSIEVDRQRNRLRSAEAMAQARAAAEEGDLTRAAGILENFRNVLAGTVSARSGDSLCVALEAELKEMQERMASRQVYESNGRGFMLSGLSAHASQRATAREPSVFGASLRFGAAMPQVYQTPTMAAMVNRSAESSKK